MLFELAFFFMVREGGVGHPFDTPGGAGPFFVNQHVSYFFSREHVPRITQIMLFDLSV